MKVTNFGSRQNYYVDRIQDRWAHLFSFQPVSGSWSLNQSEVLITSQNKDRPKSLLFVVTVEPHQSACQGTKHNHTLQQSHLIANIKITTKISYRTASCMTYRRACLNGGKAEVVLHRTIPLFYNNNNGFLTR